MLGHIMGLIMKDNFMLNLFCSLDLVYFLNNVIDNS